MEQNCFDFTIPGHTALFSCRLREFVSEPYQIEKLDEGCVFGEFYGLGDIILEYFPRDLRNEIVRRVRKSEDLFLEAIWRVKPPTLENFLALAKHIRYGNNDSDLVDPERDETERMSAVSELLKELSDQVAFKFVKIAEMIIFVKLTEPVPEEVYRPLWKKAMIFCRDYFKIDDAVFANIERVYRDDYKARELVYGTR